MDSRIDALLRATCNTAIAVFLLVTGCGLDVKTRSEERVVAVVVDASEPKLLERRCAQLAAQLAEVVRDGRGRFAAFALSTGDPATGDEPRTIVEWTAYVPPKTRLYGKTEVDTGPWLTALNERCTETLRPSRTSPIFRAIRRALEALKARCSQLAEQKTSCRAELIVISDFVETSDKEIAQAIRADSNLDDGLPHLELGGVALRACGVTERVDARRAIALGRIEDVWAAVLGTAFVIAPDCGRWDEVQP